MPKKKPAILLNDRNLISDYEMLKDEDIEVFV
jgi:hypothetical protein